MDKIKTKGISMMINSKFESKYSGYPIKIFGIKKSRNIDLSSNNHVLYLELKKFANDNKKNWCIKEEKISESNSGLEIGLGYKIRKEEINSINELINSILIKLKKER
jgi:hypothetical protein